MDARFMAIFIAFICVFAANISEGRRKLEQNISDNGVQVIDKHKAVQERDYCKKELKDSTEAVNGLCSIASDLSTLGNNGVELGSTLLAIDDLPLKEREAILHCLKRINFQLQVSEDDRLALSNNCPNLVSGSAGLPRRDLSHSRKSRILSTAHVLFPEQVDAIYSPPSNIFYNSPGTEKFSPNTSKNSNDHQKFLIAAVVATLMAALAIVTLTMLVCLNRDRRVGPTDDKPLLNFSDSDISAGSSVKPHIMGTPINMHCQTPPPTTGSSSLDANCAPSQAGFQSTEVQVETIGRIVLPLPPGRMASTAASIPAGEAGEGAVGAVAAGTGAEMGEVAAGAGAAAERGEVASGVGVVAAAGAGVEAGAGAGTEAAGDVASPSPPPPPPPNLPAPSAPPPPPRAGHHPPPNPPMPARPSPGRHHRRTSTGGSSVCSNESNAPKTKLKPFFWDKVLASPNHSMVWNEIRTGSFQFNEEMIEALFGYVAADQKKNEQTKGSSSESTPQFIQIIDPKKAQNLAILLKALNVTTEEVCDALKEGNELPSEFIQNLLKMAPTSDEELKLRFYGGELSLLGPSDRFLKAMVDIPFAFKRLESLLFMGTFQEELSSIKDSVTTLEVACKELRNSRLFLKLLEAVLKTGNRMNDGTYRGGAQAFKLETLLKLSDVKGTDGKTTLLLFVVQEIIRGEGVRAARRLRESPSMSSAMTEDLYEDASHETEGYYRNLGLQVVSGLSDELLNVKKAALIDKEILSESVSKLGQARVKTKEFLENEMNTLEEENEFVDALTGFINQCEDDITLLIEKEKQVMALVKNTGDYFHGKAGRDEGAHLFVIVRDFLLMVDKACLDVKNSIKLPPKTPQNNGCASSLPSPSQESLSEVPYAINQQLFPAIRERQMDENDDCSSDDEK